nr:immunoglobulin heavy chain junction region [Macaca mulatta]MOW99286.1 immunoglobulin heavy chain junction region [Macaca mulatta]MOX00924.1 immunoglobulin heavy chain junction region [Macaca mulatta]MOX01330.1 immunoglobulin heavy chain junction region [Macaca mulatta]MOX02555.1 immunoglobulin heavy chain junction region [Macaca mulatta]
CVRGPGFNAWSEDYGLDFW